ncbi:chromosome (plasmid) partitioning protein ParB [Jejuia pallidilutea]|nr:chromosome (plasmid) partitioning protein ParB [Jejuia pallidilutea]
MGHGRALITIEDQNAQLDIYESILSKKLSVRETEELVRLYNNPNAETSNSKSKNNDLEEMPKHVKKGIKEFSEYFGHKIDVKVSKNGKGKIIIPFHSEEDFNRIKKLVQRAK